MSIQIKEILQRKTIKNGIWLYMLQFFNMVVPLLTLPYITRVLGSSSYGVFSIALNIVSYLQVVVEYGFIMTATRKVALHESKGLNKTFTSVLISRFFLLGTCTVFSLGYCLINKHNYSLVVSFLILTTCLLGYCVQMNWIFQGMQDMNYISMVNIIGRILSTILIFIFVKKSNDLVLYSIFYSISPLISGFIGLILAKKKYSLKLEHVGINDIICELKDGFYVFTTQLSSKAFGAIGLTFLSIFATESEVGIFSAIQKIPNILLLLWAPINQVIYPIVSQNFKRGFTEGRRFVKKIERIVMPIFLMIATIVGICSQFLVNLLFGTEYTSSYYLLIPLLGWLIVAINDNFLGVQTLLGSGHDKEYGKIFQIGIIIAVFTNFVFTKKWLGLGAALAPLISEIALNLMLRYKIKKIEKQRK